MKWVKVTQTRTITREVFVPVPRNWGDQKAREAAEATVHVDLELGDVEGRNEYDTSSAIEPWEPESGIADDPPVSLAILDRLTPDELAVMWADARFRDDVPDSLLESLEQRFNRQAHRESGLAKLTAAEKAALGVS